MQGIPRDSSASGANGTGRAVSSARFLAAERTIPATHGRRRVTRDPEHERSLAAHLRRDYSRDDISPLYDRHREGGGRFDAMMRRVTLRALCRRFGDGIGTQGCAQKLNMIFFIAGNFCEYTKSCIRF